MSQATNISQEQLLKYIKPRMQQEGQLHQKSTNIFARAALEGEMITSVTSSGEETTNWAEPGDFLVKNQTEAGEAYLVSGEKFEQKYDYLRPAEEGFSEYRSKGKIYALEITPSMLSDLDLPESFHYEAPWGTAAFAQKSDFWVMPLDYSEVYRIGRPEFQATYQLIQNPS